MIFTNFKKVSRCGKPIFSMNLRKSSENQSNLSHFGVKRPDFTNSECRPDFKTCFEDFEHFQTWSKYTGTFRALKFEKPEKVVWGAQNRFRF